MKQTTNYQFNLIESSDTFSPNPLNENAEKTEEAILSLGSDLRETFSAALGSGGHTARIDFGTYIGSGPPTGMTDPWPSTALTFSFKPMLVYISGGSDGLAYLFAYPKTDFDPVCGEGYTYARTAAVWSGNSVSWSNSGGMDYQLNEKDVVYHWIAVGYDANT